MNDKNSPDKLGVSLNSLSNQRNRMLNEFRTGKQLSTFFIRDILGIPHPAGRVKELRVKYRIITQWTHEADKNGIMHRIALYVYMGNKKSVGGH